MAKSTKAPSSLTIVSAIINKFAEGKKALEALEATSIIEQDAEIQKLVDYHLVTCTTTKALYMKGNSATNPARKEVKDLFTKLSEMGCFDKGSIKTYQGCFWIAFEKGVPFGRNLANEKTATKKAETAKKDATPKAGKVEVTTIEEMHKTLSKALAQGRMLNQLVFVPALLDFIVEHYPDFKETVLAK